MEHFGVKLIDKGKGFRLTRDTFALINTKPSLPYFESLAKLNAYTDESGVAYSENWCLEYREICLKNYDLNIEYFSKLERSFFNAHLSSFLAKNKHFVEIKDLNKVNGTEGFYIMVLDEYKQVYIGKSENIRKRIMTHWSSTKPFDRTLLPMYAWKKSTFSIDFFKALDTTRIYVWKRKITDGIEADLINDFDGRFCTNRIGGDITNLLQAITTTNVRQL